MTTTSSEGENGEGAPNSDKRDKLKEYRSRCYILTVQKNEKILTKQNLIALNMKNEKISQSLLRKKMEYEDMKSDLSKALFNVKISTSKQKILLRKTLDEFLMKRKNLEEQYRKLPFVLGLEEVVIANNNLFEDYKKITHLLESTKKQYEEMMEKLFKNFKKKVCDFCDIAVKFKALNN